MLKYKIPQIVTLTRIHLPQIVLKKRILIANYLTIRILFGAANGIRTRDPQLGKLIKVFHNHILINVLYII